MVLAALGLGATQTLAIAVKDFDPFPPALGLKSPVEHLRDRGVPQLLIGDWIRERAGAGSRVLVLGDARTAWLPPACTAASVFESHPLAAWTGQAASPQDLDATVRRKGYDFVVFNAAEWARVRQTPPSPAYWPDGDEAARRRFEGWLDLLRAMPPQDRLVSGESLVAWLR